MKALATTNQDKWWQLLLALIILSTLFVGIGTILIGNFPFWYDPARDFLMAWDNLSHPTLIGPTSGIPGIFYGPYWIWLLSIGVFISKDPRIAMLIVLTIPYLLILPIFFIRAMKTYGKVALVGVWGLYAATFGIEYATKPWNPYLAPILLIVLIAIFSNLDLKTISKNTISRLLLAGIVGGLIANAHLSLGSGILIGSGIYLILSTIFADSLKRGDLVKRLTRSLTSGVVFAIGVGISFIPFMLFEARHGFNQTKMLIFMVTSPFPVVGVQGLSSDDILRQFPLVAVRLFGVPEDLMKIIFVLLTCVFLVMIVEKKVVLTQIDKRILASITCIFITLFSIYMKSKNPVWEYHFIGMEVLLFFYILIIADKMRLIRFAIIIFAGSLLISHVSSFTHVLQSDERFEDVLSTKIEVTESVIKDAGGSHYVVYPHSSSIYTYDYAYLFRWKKGVNVPFDPSQNTNKSNTAYLIIPSVGTAVKQDFISGKTRDGGYVLTKEWAVREVEVQKIEKK